MDPKTPVSMLDGLPEVYWSLIPDLASITLPVETRADCAHCPMVLEVSGVGPSQEYSFVDEVRCCTFFPELPNFLVGQVFEHGGPGADRVRARLSDRSTVLPAGLRETSEWQAQYDQGRRKFGRDLSLRCPYYIDAPLTCSIWPDRPPLCRCWFCKHVEGRFSRHRWTALRDLLERMTNHLVAYCIEKGSPPAPEADDKEWEDWYLQCTERVRNIPESDRTAISQVLAENSQKELNALTNPIPETPDVLLPHPSGCHNQPHGLRLVGYSSFDTWDADIRILGFFEQLDGFRPWKQVCEDRPGHGSMPIDEPLIDRLYKCGILISPQEAKEEKFQVLPAVVQAPETAGQERSNRLQVAVRQFISTPLGTWLQSATTLQSVLAPRSIFTFLSRLDEDRDWAEILAEMPQQGLAELDVPLMMRLIGAGILQER